MDREALLTPFAKAAGDFSTSIFDGWDVVPGFVGDAHVCTSLIKGSEIHFYVIPEFRGRLAHLRRRAAEYFGPMLERHGFLTTRVLLERDVERRFVERVGFKPTWSDGQFQYYMLGRQPFARSES